MRALSIAATGMSAQQSNVEVIANNIANVNTTGFKRARAEFSDLLYQTDRRAGLSGRSTDEGIPESVSFGLGVRPVAVRNLHLQGSFVQTGNPLDLALNGRGFFQLTGPNGEMMFSRAGSFSKDASGQLVNGDGLALNPAIVIPANATEIQINPAGQVFARNANTNLMQSVGQISLAHFSNEAGLEAVGGNLFRETEASGAATSVTAASPGIATVQQGYLESSNVDPVKEMTELIAAQRAYEMNSKVIQAADDMYGVVAKGLR